jgi:hypothetical protein
LPLGLGGAHGLDLGARRLVLGPRVEHEPVGAVDADQPCGGEALKGGVYDLARHPAHAVCAHAQEGPVCEPSGAVATHVVPHGARGGEPLPRPADGFEAVNLRVFGKAVVGDEPGHQIHPRA